MYLTNTIIITLLAVGITTPVSSSDISTSAMANLPKKMKAVGLYKYLPISDPESLIDIEVDVPTPEDNEALIEVKAIAMNPVDVKLRAPKPTVETKPKILGVDGAGVVVAVGKKVNSLTVGEEVMFAADVRKDGTNAQYVAVDQIHVVAKPKSLTFEQAAAMPATSMLAFEILHDRLLISENGGDKDKTLLIINSAGGVGSAATQLAKIAGLKVIGTASRSETTNYSLEQGADIVLNHTQDLLPQLADKGYKGAVDFILVNYDPYPYWDTVIEAIKPQGKICVIVESSKLVDINKLQFKSITLAAEMIATRSIFKTDDLFRQHEMLKKISEYLETGKMKSTLTKTMSPINAANLREAHRLIEGNRMIGKLVLHGF